MSTPARTSTTRGIDFPGMDELKSTARTIFANCGINYGPNKINRLCVQFANRVQYNGFEFFDFLINAVQLSDAQKRRALMNSDIARAIAYADPTGEAAVNNVMRALKHS